MGCCDQHSDRVEEHFLKTWRGSEPRNNGSTPGVGSESGIAAGGSVESESGCLSHTERRRFGGSNPQLPSRRNLRRVNAREIRSGECTCCHCCRRTSSRERTDGNLDCG